MTESLLDLAFRGIAEGNWFLVAGPILAGVVSVARWALGQYWPALATSDRWGVAVAAALAGAGALAHAWIAGEAVADATTLLGAVKVFAAAVASYVTTRKLVAPRTRPPADAQAGFVRLEVMLAYLLVGVLAGGAVACGWLKSESRETAKNVVDCTSANVRSLNRQFGPVIDEVIVQATSDDGKVDWSRVKHATRGLAVSTGLCVLAHSVQRALVPVQQALDAPKSEALEVKPEALRAGFAELAGGRRFKTELGEL